MLDWTEGNENFLHPTINFQAIINCCKTGWKTLKFLFFLNFHAEFAILHQN